LEVTGYRLNGIEIYGDRKGHSGFRDVGITRCRVHDNGDKGIASVGPQPAGDWGHQDLYIGYCAVYNNRGISGKKGHTGNGIVISSVDGGTIEYCTACNNGENSDDPESGGPIGIWAWDSREVVIQYCESYDNKTGNRADGGGFDLDGGCVGCIMQYNYSHGNHGAGYGIYQYTHAREFRDNVVRYNISENDGINNHYGGINLWSTNSSGGIQNTRIYNNTIFLSESTNGGGIAEIPDDDDTSYVYHTQVYNNIIVGVTGKTLVDIPNPSDQWKFLGNCYWTYGEDITIKWDNKVFRSLEEWRASSDQETFENKVAGVETDPGLSSLGSGGTVGDPSMLKALTEYKLQKSSMLIDRGIDIQSMTVEDVGSHDFFGNPIPSGGGYDIGAHEFDQDDNITKTEK